MINVIMNENSRIANVDEDLVLQMSDVNRSDILVLVFYNGSQRRQADEVTAHYLDLLVECTALVGILTILRP